MADKVESEYEATFGMLSKKKLDLLIERTDVELKLSEIKSQIAHLSEILDHLAPMAGMPVRDNISAMGITDAIRWVLKSTEDRMAPIDVRDKLTEKGFDLSGLTAPMASIYKILARLADGPTPEVVREREDDGKVYYRWITLPDEPPF